MFARFFRKLAMLRMTRAARRGRWLNRRRKLLGNYFRLEDRVTPASTWSLSGTNLTIDLVNGDDVTITRNASTITWQLGAGQTWATPSSGNYTVSGTTLTANAAGTTALTGTVNITDSGTGNATVTFNNQGGNHLTNYNINLDGGSNAITINGVQNFVGEGALTFISNGTFTLNSTADVDGDSATIAADAVSINTSGGNKLSVSGTISIRQFTNGQLIDIGGADSPGTLGLTNAELDDVSADALVIGNASSGNLTVNEAIGRDENTDMTLSSGGSVIISGGEVETSGGSLLLDPNGAGSVQPTFGPGNDVSGAPTTFSGNTTIDISGGTVHTQYNQLTSDDDIVLSGNLVLTGAFVPANGQTFTIVSTTGELSGVFANLPTDGSTIAFGSGTMSVQYNTAAFTETVVLTYNAAVNVAPVVDLNAGGGGNDVTVAFTEQTPALIAPVATITDSDDVNLESMTVTLTARPDGNAVESLSLNGSASAAAAGLTVSYTAATGVLSISGTATVATYQTILQGILYNNTSDAPTTSNRSVTVVVNDGDVNSTSRTSTVTVAAVNDAPVLDNLASPVLAAINEDDTSNMGSTVASIVVDGSITDPDVSPAPEAIAVLSVDNTNGTWQYSIDDGTTWLPFTGVSPTNAYLLDGTLTGGATNRIRFVPNANFNSPPNVAITIKAWDMSAGGGPGSTANATPGGGSSAFSVVADTATITVNPVNDAPVATGIATLASVAEDTVSPPGATVTSLFTANFSDSADSPSNTLYGVAIVSNSANSGTEGEWQYFNGSVWTSLPAVSTGSALVVQSTHALRFLPNANYNGTPGGLNVHLIETGGATPTTGSTVNLTGATGGSTIYSAATVALGTSVTAVNDAPSAMISVDPYSASEQTPLDLKGTLSVSDLDSGLNDVQVTLSVVEGILTVTAGTSGVTSITGNNTNSVVILGTVAEIHALFNTDGTSTVIYTNTLENPSASDTLTLAIDDLGNTGTPGALTASDTATINITAINDPPTVSAGGTLNYDEDDPPTAIDNSVTPNDVDNLTLSSATVQLTTNYVNGQDLLAFSTMFGITGNFVPATGTLTLTGVATLAQYQTALRSVTYENNSDNPSTLPRTVVWTVNDGTANSQTAFSTINVEAFNDAPTATIGTDPYSATEGVSLDLKNTGMLVGDVDANAGSVTVTLSVTQGALNVTAGTSGAGVSGSGSSLVTLTGTIAQINALLNTDGTSTVSYINSIDNPAASATLTLGINDNGNTGTGGAMGTSDTATINITAVNDAPTVTVPGPQNTDEDIALPIAGISVSDPDVNAGLMEITLSVNDGTLTMTTLTGLLFSVGDGTGDATMTFTGTLTDVNNALASLSYLGDLNFNGGDTLTVSVSDQGNTGTGPVGTDSDTVAITVDPVNDAPQGTDGSVSTAEDTPYVFTTADFGFSDPVEGDAFLSVIITTLPGAGTLLLNGVGVAALDEITVADINANLLTFEPAPDANGSPYTTFTFQVRDDGGTANSGVDTDQTPNTMTINVTAENDAPIVTVPMGPINGMEDVSLPIPGVSVSDVDATNMEITLSVNDGTLTMTTTTGLLFSVGDGSGDATMTFTGTLTDVNNALATLSYLGDLNYNGPDQLTVTADDQGETGNGGAMFDTEIVALNLVAVNDAPIVNVPMGPINGMEDVSLPIPGVSVTDVDATTMRVHVSVLNGTLTMGTVAGLTFDVGFGNGTADVRFVGSLADVNTALGTLSYLTNLNYNGPDTLTVHANDQGSTGGGPGLIDTELVALNLVAVNDGPTVTVPMSPINGQEDVVLPIGGISVADVDATTMRMTLSVDFGTLTLGTVAGLTFDSGFGNGTSELRFVGSFADVNTALGTLSYLTDLHYNGPDTLTVTANDQGSTGGGPGLIDTELVALNLTAVNDAPVINVVTDPYNVNEDAILSLAGQISVTDVDIAAGIMNVTLFSTHGTMTMTTIAGLTFTIGDGLDDTNMAFSGTLAAVNAALATMSYDSDPNYFGAATITINVNDNGNTPAPPLGDNHVININVVPVNDGPTVTVPGTQFVNEDTANNPIAGVSVFDPDSGALDVEVTLTAGNGSLTVVMGGLTSLSGNGSGLVVLTGSLAAVNAALATLDYTPNMNFIGNDTIGVAIDDLGSTGGGSLTDSDSFTVTVANVDNDAPVVSVPGAQTVDEDTPLLIGGISVADPDILAGNFHVSLSVLNGTITLGTIAGLTFDVGFGNGTDDVRFTGTSAAVNAALATLSYQGDLNYAGPDTLTVTVDDQGNTGTGGAQSDTETVDITVDAINDAPVITAPASVNGVEDTVFSFTGGALISIADPDAHLGTNEIEVSLQISSDTISLGSIAGLTFSVGDGTLDSIMTFRGTLTAVNAALATLVYTPDPNFNSASPNVPAILSINVSDLGNFPAPTLTDSANVTVNVAPVNDAPVLGGGTSNLTGINEDQTLISNTGTLVSTLLGAAQTDVDFMAVEGIAITSVTGIANGTWQFSINGGGSWAAFPAIPSGSALLLASDAMTLVRFVPNANYNTASGPLPSITFHGWDQTQGMGASVFVLPGVLGGSTAFSTASAVSTIAVTAINDAPTIAGVTTLNTNENTPVNITGPAVSVADVDLNEGTGIIEVSLASTNGTMTMTVLAGLSFTIGDGTADTAMTFTGTLAAVNAALASLSFNPTLNYNGPATITVDANDLGNFPTPAQSAVQHVVNITVNEINNAPVASGAATLAAVSEDTTNPAGASVSSLFTANFNDSADNPTPDTLHGVAIIANAATAAQGTWQYFSGGVWTNVPAVSLSSAFVVQSADLLRFLPAANFNGNPGSLTVHLIETGLGAPATGASVNLSGMGATGGATIYSAATVVLSTSITAVNDAPIASGAATLTAVNEDAANPPGATVTALFGGNFSDTADNPAANTLYGVAIIANASTGAQGTWQYFSGGVWTNLPAVSLGTAFVVTSADSLRFLPAANFNGAPGSLTVHLIETGGATPATGATVDLSTMGATGGSTIFSVSTVVLSTTITAINDAPVFAGTTAAVTNEDTPVAIPGITLNDVDLGGGNIQVTLNSSHGTMTMSVLAGLSFVFSDANGTGVGDGTTDSAMTFRGSLAAVNAALASLTFNPDLNYNGAATITANANDLGNTPAPPQNATPHVVTITVNAVNDAPVASGSATLAAVNEDTANPAGATVSSLFTANFSDAADNPTPDTLHGVAIIANAATGAQGTWQYFSGTWQNIPAVALNSAFVVQSANLLRFLPAVNFNGAPGSLTVRLIETDGSAPLTGASVDLSGVGATGGSTIYSAASVVLSTSITAVNDAPVVTNPSPALNYTEGDAAAQITAGATVTDVDSPDFNTGSLTVAYTTNGATGDRLTIANIGTGPGQIGVSGSTVTFGGLTIGTFTGGTFSSNLVVTFTTTNATPAAVEALIRAIRYDSTSQNPSQLPRTITFTVNDGDGGSSTGSATATINVTAVNDAPIVAAPATAMTNEDTPVAIPGVNVSDVDLGGGQYQITLTAVNGTMTITPSGVSFSTGDGSADTVMVFTGTQAQVTAALATLSFAPDANFNGAASVTILASDQGNSPSGALTDSKVVNITVNAVNDAPTISAPAAASTNEDTMLPFTGGNTITIGDVDAGAGTLDLTLSVTNGILNMVGGTGTGTSSVTFSGTLGAINAALATLQYVPNSNYNGPDTLSITVDDNGFTGSGGVLTTMGSVAINVINVDNDAPVIAVTPGGTRFTDEDMLLNLTGISVSDSDVGAGIMDVVVTATNGTLNMTGATGNGTSSVTFSGTLAAVNAALASLSFTPTGDYNGPATVTVGVDDNGNSGTGGVMSDSEVINITVNAVNDAPVLTVPGAQAVGEDSVNNPIAGISIVDVDAGAGSLTLTLTVTNGTLNMTGGAGNGTNSVTFNGTVAAINAALLTLTYSPNANYFGGDMLNVTINDNGNTGLEGPKSDTDSVAITVNGVNDAPSFTAGPNIEFTVQQTTNTPTFATAWPSTQNVAAWATALSAGPGETIISSGTPDANQQIVTFEVQVLTNAALFTGTPTITVDGGLSTATLHFTPAPQQFGTAILRARIQDNFPSAPGLSSSWKIFTITIAPEENSPQPKVRYLDPKLDVGAPTTSSTAPAVATNMVTGDFVTVWSDQANTTISFQMYSANGVPGASGTVNTSGGSNAKPAVAMAIDGSFVVAWENNSDDLRARRFSAAGAPLGGEFTVNATLAGQQANVALSMNIDGSFQAAFSSPDASGNGVFMRRFNAGGTAIDGSDRAVNTTTLGSQSNPSISSDASNNFVVAWQGLDASGSGVFARRYDAGSDSFGSEFAVNTTTTGNDVAPGVGMDAVGNFVVGWANALAGTSRIRFQQYSTAGLPFGAEVTVETVSGYLSSASTAMDADGDFVMLWDTPTGIEGTRYRVTGAHDDDYEVTSVSSPDSVQLPRVAADGDGDFVAVWTRTVSGNGKIDLQQYKYNEAPYDLDFTGPASINETADAVPATITADFEAFDFNPDDTFTYSLDNDAGGRFSIHPTTGVISIVNPANIDYESAPILSPTTKGYTVTARVVDIHGLFRTATQIIEVNDVNETPVLTLTPPVPTIAEHTANGTVVGTLNTADADAADDPGPPAGNPTFSTFSYTLVDSAGGRFAINMAGQIVVADADNLEYNDAIDDGMGGRYFEVTVRTTDGGGLFDEEEFRIYVTAVADTVITNIRVGDDMVGRSQRSFIDQVQVTFSQPINLGMSNVPAAFTLTRLDDMTPVTVTVTWNGTFTVATLTFSGSNTFAGSVNDGNYRLLIDGSQLRNNAGIQIDADGDNAAGGTRDFRFYRLFGDFVTTGEYTMPASSLSWRVVDNLDFAFFTAAFGAIVPDANYEVAFDFDSDDDVDNIDFAQFVFRFGTELLPIL